MEMKALTITTKNKEIMIYKITNDAQKIEVEEFEMDSYISISVFDGVYENREIKHTTRINLELSKRKCEDLIKALQHALSDYNEYSNQTS